MKRILFTIALVVAALSAFAQQQEVEPKPSHANFVTNKFWDNWEISAGVGGQTWFFGDNQDEGKFGKRLSYEVDLSATKWITPVFGARLQGQGLQMKSTCLYMNKVGASDYVWDDGSVCPQGDWSYYFIHADALINVRNWIGGYKEMRVWQPVVFGGFGYARSHISGDNKYANGNQEWAFSYGLLNKFRISKAVDLNLELKNMLVRESFSRKLAPAVVRKESTASAPACRSDNAAAQYNTPSHWYTPRGWVTFSNLPYWREPHSEPYPAASPLN